MTCSYCGSKNVVMHDSDITREYPGGFEVLESYFCESCGAWCSRRIQVKTESEVQGE